jgi:hypothetical protein
MLKQNQMTSTILKLPIADELWRNAKMIFVGLATTKGLQCVPPAGGALLDNEATQSVPPAGGGLQSKKTQLEKKKRQRQSGNQRARSR